MDLEEISWLQDGKRYKTDVANTEQLFPDEFTESRYTKKLRGALAKAKANAAQNRYLATAVVRIKDKKENVGTATPQSGQYSIFIEDRRFLSWSHYERLLQVSDSAARLWYEKEALEQSWSVRTLR